MRLFILSLFVLLLGAGTASAQSASEAKCTSGDAEACFYTAADYAQGQGVAANPQTAVRYFLKACEGGIPDGCMYAGDITYNGQGNVSANRPLGLNYFERTCRMSHVEGCDRVYKKLGPEAGDLRDVPRLINVLEAGCKTGLLQACVDIAGILYDGGPDKLTGYIDWKRAGPYAEIGCNVRKEKVYCPIAENIYANPKSPAFDAQKALTYTNMNCDEGDARACLNLGGIYLEIDDADYALAAFEKGCKLQPSSKNCYHAADTKRYMAEVAEHDKWLAEKTAREAAVNDLLAAKNYGQAVNVAVHQVRSTDLAARAALAARDAGAVSQINTQDLYVLAYWFPTGPVQDMAKAEMRKRGTGLEGRFGEGTNTAGAADARYRAQYGSNMPTYTSSSYSSPQKPMPSTSSIQAATKERYRWAHCTMRGNSGSAKVCQ